MDADVRMLTLDTGLTVPYVTHGSADGTAIVLLHGWAESMGVFDRLIPLLPERFHTIAFDLRGHGGATKPHSGYSLEEVATDVRAFLDAVGVASAVLLGSSSGGYIAQQVAVSNPDRVAALVLVGAPRSLAGRPPFAGDVDALTDPVDAGWVRASLDWFRLHTPVPAEYLAERVRDGVRMPAHAWRLSLDGLTSARPPSLARRIPLPALIIRGAHDDVISLEEHERLASAIPGSRLISYDDTGHLVLWEQPDRIASDVTAFLDGLVPRPRKK